MAFFDAINPFSVKTNILEPFRVYHEDEEKKEAPFKKRLLLEEDTFITLMKKIKWRGVSFSKRIEMLNHSIFGSHYRYHYWRYDDSFELKRATLWICMEQVKENKFVYDHTTKTLQYMDENAQIIPIQMNASDKKFISALYIETQKTKNREETAINVSLFEMMEKAENKQSDPWGKIDEERYPQIRLLEILCKYDQSVPRGQKGLLDFLIFPLIARSCLCMVSESYFNAVNAPPIYWSGAIQICFYGAVLELARLILGIALVISLSVTILPLIHLVDMLLPVTPLPVVNNSAQSQSEELGTDGANSYESVCIA